ncbi:PE-PPE domain-containing protein [Mycolicibacterium sp.]|uniref:PE-PPE domain-containing protein n=1 Tax=Mycolicibacterium sp. TaxID=2320850 RepID=UPI001A35B905|nr:PE-PPE domain-containing protein [Mycolicibacterium sp.]MBJ7339252.1 PE-PPE domain-containing protein [Mycolicibacterium sp.]
MAATVLVGAPGVMAAAQTRIGLNGGRPTEWSFLAPILAGQGLTQQGWLDFASHVGENWLPGSNPVPVDYPAQLGVVSGPGALTADQSTLAGQQILHDIITRELAKGEPVAVAGLSEGTLVIDQELAYLARDPATAPAADMIKFYVFGDMLRGLGQMYLKGLSIPFIGQTFGPVPESQYDTVVVNEQWDGWANPPDRPWNLLAVLNAVMGAVYTVNGSNDHSQTSLDSLSQAVKVSETVNGLGGKTTTYMIPRKELPLTRPLRQLGVPGWIVDEIDKLLTPLILTGYSAMTPGLGPRIDGGQLVFTSAPAPLGNAAPLVEPKEASTVQTATNDPAPNPVAARTSSSANAVDPTEVKRQPVLRPAAITETDDPEPQAVESAGVRTSLEGQPQPTATSRAQPADPADTTSTSTPRPGDVNDDHPDDRRTNDSGARDAETKESEAKGPIKADSDSGASHQPRSTPARDSAGSDGAASEASKPAA